jgi:Ras-related protein Rab-18
MFEENNNSYTILALGESTVGKSAYIQNYVYNIFKATSPTIGCNIISKYLYSSNEEKIKIKFVDISGKERYQFLPLLFIKQAHGVILMYDITRKNTFNTISNWWEKILDSKDKDFPAILIGNKCDLENQREVQKEEGEKIAKELGIKLLEVSNKNGISIKESARELIKMILKNDGKNDDINSVKLDKKKLRKRKKEKCCK